MTTKDKFEEIIVPEDLVFMITEENIGCIGIYHRQTSFSFMLSQSFGLRESNYIFPHRFTTYDYKDIKSVTTLKSAKDMKIMLKDYIENTNL